MSMLKVAAWPSPRVFSRSRRFGLFFILPPIAHQAFPRARGLASHHAPPPKLRPYQEECVQSVLAAFRDNRRKVGVSLATGGGKTVIFTELIGRVHPPTPNATKTLILVHRRELVEQALRHCSARYPDLTVEIELGKVHASGYADITVASVQSINSQDRVEKFDPASYKLVLVDEAHHIVADTYLRVLDHFGLMTDSDEHVPSLVGVSATFSRHDGLALGKAIKHIVFHKDYVDMIGEKWLSDVIFTTVKSGADLSKVRSTKGGDFSTTSLSNAVNQEQTNNITVRSWMHKAGARKSTLVFCVDIAHLDALTNTFRRHGFEARSVTAQTPSKQRAETVDAFRAGHFPVLLNCGVFTEGTDIPNIDCVILARPTRSRNLLVQMIGRGMRLHHNKRNCHVIDMVASLEDGIVTVPSLFGLDSSELVHNATPEQMKSDRDLKEKEKERKDKELMQDMLVRQGISADSTSSGDVNVRFTDYDSITDLISDTSGERHIRAISKHAWVCVSASKYVLTNGPAASLLMLERTPGSLSPETESDSQSPGSSEHAAEWTVKLFISSAGISTTKAPFLRPRTIASGRTFESAVHSADTYAAERFTRNFTIAHGPQARWREGTATQAQVDFLNKRLPAEAGQEKLQPDSMTKGEAGDMITKIKHGAKGVWKAMQAIRSRMEKRARLEEKQREYWAGESVEVGPVLEAADSKP